MVEYWSDDIPRIELISPTLHYSTTPFFYSLQFGMRLLSVLEINSMIFHGIKAENYLYG